MLSGREKFLMQQSFNAGEYYDNFEEWLIEPITEDGLVVEQHLEHDADRLHGKANFIIE